MDDGFVWWLLNRGLDVCLHIISCCTGEWFYNYFAGVAGLLWHFPSFQIFDNWITNYINYQIIFFNVIHMSNWIKLQPLLPVMLLKHFKIALLLHHWLNCNLSIISEFLFSTSCLRTFPSTHFFDGFIKRRVEL